MAQGKFGFFAVTAVAMLFSLPGIEFRIHLRAVSLRYTLSGVDAEKTGKRGNALPFTIEMFGRFRTPSRGFAVQLSMCQTFAMRSCVTGDRSC